MASRQNPKEPRLRAVSRPQAAGLRLRDQKTRIRGMNIAMKAAREYLKDAGITRVWPAQLARLIDANLRLAGQHIIVRISRLERAGDRAGTGRLFSEEMQKVGVAAAREFLSKGS